MSLSNYLLSKHHAYFCRGNTSSFFISLALAALSSLIVYGISMFDIRFAALLMFAFSIIIVAVTIAYLYEVGNFERVPAPVRLFLCLGLSLSIGFFIGVFIEKAEYVFYGTSIYLFFIFLSHYFVVIPFLAPTSDYQGDILFIIQDLKAMKSKYPNEIAYLHERLRHTGTTISFDNFMKYIIELEMKFDYQTKSKL